MTSLAAALAGHHVEVRDYHPGLDFSCFDKDLIILSGGGGEGLEINDEHRPGKLWYEDEMKFVLSTNKPVLGICMGFEIIAKAYGAKIVEKPDLVTGFNPVVTSSKAYAVLGKKQLTQFESHYWRVEDLAHTNLEVLADSVTGIEIFKHKTKPILATQFHPEKGGSLHLNQILAGGAI